jgi:hypothetical protein
MRTSTEVTNIFPALIAALGEIKAVRKDAKNPFLENKYASLDAIIEASKPILAAHGLTAIQTVNDDGVETMILHTSGEWIGSGEIKIASEVTNGLSAAQAYGVAITYSKRYQLGAMLNISTDEDTDGQYGDNKDLHPALPELLQTDSKKIQGIALTIADGKFKLDQYRKKYVISPETEMLINGEVQNILLGREQAAAINKQAPPKEYVRKETDKTIF